MFASLKRAVLAGLVAALCAACQTPAASDPPARPTHGAEGGLCGGIAGFQCSGDLYCHITQGQCRTIADVAGTCQAKPQICNMLYAPVCGCDGKTYPSACNAASKGVSVAAQGACKG